MSSMRGLSGGWLICAEQGNLHLLQDVSEGKSHSLE